MIKALIFSIALIWLSFPAHAQSHIELNQWAQLPVLHEGRLKPLDSFARVHLKKFSGKEGIGDSSASEWLAQVLFTPDEAAITPIFKIRNFETYGLPKKENELHSYVEIAPIIHERRETIETLLSTKAKSWTPQQQELIELYKNVSLYVQLLRSLTALLPLNIKSKTSKSYLDLKDTPPLSTPLKIIKAGGVNNIYLQLIPKNWDNLNGEWQSIWDSVNGDKIEKNDLLYIKNWKNLAGAYRESSQKQWDSTLNKTPADLTSTRLKTEYVYNIIKLLTMAGILYLISFALIVASNLLQKKQLGKAALLSLSIGAIANAFDIILRIYILNRPPVGTLYESIIFTSFVCVLGFLMFEKKHKNKTGLLLGSISGILLIITAKSFAGDDTMDTLVAVLNTNFWLLTHVICITIGYAICFLTAMLAHYYLVIKIWREMRVDLLKHLSQAIKTLAILALLFTSIGTILGGIWADQSWGRFWGWDPKENGALLIVLWLIWLLHGKISKHINETGFIIGAALLSIIVVIAWFGVNLLSVGLHSYGFTTGVTLGIVLFCAIEAFIIGGLWLLGRKTGLPA